MIALFTLLLTLSTFAQEAGRTFFLMPVTAVDPGAKTSKVGELCEEKPTEGTCYVVTIPAKDKAVADQLAAAVFDANGQKMAAFEIPPSAQGTPNIDLKGRDLFIEGIKSTVPSGWVANVNTSKDVVIAPAGKLKVDIDLDGSNTETLTLGIIKGTKGSGTQPYVGPMKVKQGSFAGVKYTWKFGGNK